MHSEGSALDTNGKDHSDVKDHTNAKTVELINQQGQRGGTLGYHATTSMDLITQNVWSNFNQRGDDASGHHLGQPPTGGEVLWKSHQYCAGTFFE